VNCNCEDPSGESRLSPDAIKERLREENPEALLADGFDAALIGVGRRCGQPALAVYSYAKAIDVLIEQGLSYEDAVEHMEFNVVGGWLGPHTPLFLME
jgi:hypothetical protein